MPCVGIVVLNWHGRDRTVACLRALAALEGPDRLVVVIDNGCAELDAARVEGLLPGAVYLRTAENLGFTGGANLGAREAIARGCDLLWLLNNDARPEPSSLRELTAAMASDPRIGIAGAKILRGDDPSVIDSVCFDVDLSTGRAYLRGHGETDRGQYDALRDVGAVTGCAMLVRGKAWSEVGGFDENYFAYYEDADLCLRLRAAGWRVISVPGSRVLHDRAPAGGERQSVSSLYYSTRNHLRLLRRHGVGGSWRATLRSSFVVGLNAAYALRSAPRPARLAAVWRGARDARV